MSKWILTSQALPSEQYVLAWNGRQFFAAFASAIGELSEVGSHKRIEDVTHWTPFPLAENLSFRYEPQPA
jgi:hypothetical protein